MLYKRLIMRRIIITAIAIIMSTSMFAQLGNLLYFNSGGKISLQWNMASPMGDMKDITSKYSFSGISIDYRHCYKQNIIIGG